jgi:hypothetical protein
MGGFPRGTIGVCAYTVAWRLEGITNVHTEQMTAFGAGYTKERCVHIYFQCKLKITGFVYLVYIISDCECIDVRTIYVLSK